MNNSADNNHIQPIVVTDLDGTLLDHETYDYAPALEAIRTIKEQHVPLILASSKTYAEMSALQEELQIIHPAIIENGGGVYIPERYFENIDDAYSPGTPYLRIIEILNASDTTLRHCFQGFCDWSVEQVQEKTGLSFAAAKKAMKREWSVPGVWSGSDDEFKRFTSYLEAQKLQVTRGGRFIHIMGQTSKGKMLLWLKEQYAKKYTGRRIMAIALGDAPNDRIMLEVADHAIVIPNASGTLLDLNPENMNGVLHNATMPGPAGWNDTVLNVLKEL